MPRSPLDILSEEAMVLDRELGALNERVRDTEADAILAREERANCEQEIKDILGAIQKLEGSRGATN